MSAIMTSAKEMPRINFKLEHKKERVRYREIMKAFFERLYYHLVTTGDRIYLPRLGSLRMIQYDIELYKDLAKKKKGKSRELIDFAALAKMKKAGKEITKYPIINQKHTNNRWWWLKWIPAKYIPKSNIFEIVFSNSNRKKNSVNKHIPEVLVSDFYRDKGYLIYKIGRKSSVKEEEDD
jgi:hypothetical protein